MPDPCPAPSAPPSLGALTRAAELRAVLAALTSPEEGDQLIARALDRERHDERERACQAVCPLCENHAPLAPGDVTRHPMPSGHKVTCRALEIRIRLALWDADPLTGGA